MTGKDQIIPEAAQPSGININYGKSFYDWISGPHRGIRRILIAIGIIIALYLCYCLSWIIPVFFVASLILGYIVFRNAFFTEDAVRVIAFYDDDPSVCDMLLIGKEKFSRLSRDGDITPFVSSSGDPVFFAEDLSHDNIRFAWSHECSRFEFIMKRSAFDEAAKLAESSAAKLYKIQNIPNILALKLSGDYIRRYDSYYERILSDEDEERIIEDSLKDIASTIEKKEEGE